MSTDRRVGASLEIDTASRLAFERTRVAYERTMLAWIRTATSLITFGFTIYKFFQLELGSAEQHDRIIGPREFSLTLVSIGLLSLVLATLDYRGNMRALMAQDAGHRRSLALVVAGVIAILGVLALVVVILRQ